MNNNAVRLVLAAVAPFYVVTGGLWAADYFPLQKFYAQVEVREELIEKHGFDRAFDTAEYKEARAYEQTYALNHPGIVETENKLAFLGSLLLWGTVALGVGGGVLFLTRRNGKGLPAAPKAE